MALQKKLGKYEIIRLIGSGSFGEVFEARHPDLDISRAIKIPHDQQENAKVSIKEAVLQARLNHPNIVQVIDVETIDQTLFIVMEYCCGGNLRTVLRPGEPLEPDISRRIILQLTKALDYAHSQNIIHRDLKPENILFSTEYDGTGKDSVIKISDFGLATIFKDFFEHKSRVAGTLNYMAPESMDGEATPQSDLWSLGAVFYELITGQICFGGKTPWEIMNGILKKDLPRPGEVNPVLSADVEEIVLKLLRKDQGTRYKTAVELIQDLKTIGNHAASRKISEFHPRPSAQVTQISLKWPCYQGNPQRTGAHQPKLGASLKRAWRCRIGSRFYSAPVSSLGTIVFGANDGNVYGVDALSGELRWKHQTGGSIMASPVVSKGFCYLGSYSGHFYCLDMITGESVWHTDLKSAISATALLLNNTIYAAANDGALWTLAADSGESKTVFQTPAGIEASPVVFDDRIILVDQEGHVCAISIENHNRIWDFNSNSRIDASPSLAGNMVYVGDYNGQLHGLSVDSGREYRCKNLGDWIVSSVCIIQDKLIACTKSGLIRCFHLIDDEELWHIDIDDEITAGPSVAWPWVIAGSDSGDIHVVDGESGQEHDCINFGDFITTPPTIIGDTLYVGCADGCLYALR